MLQRIQTLYLLIVTGLMLSIFFTPIAEILVNANKIYLFSYNGLSIESSEAELFFKTIPPMILLIVTTVIPFLSIFMYKKRIRQMRLNFFNILLLLGYIGINYFYIHNFQKQLSGLVSYKLVAIFPAIAIILTYLAIRAIGKDEALVRSADRLRG